MITGTRIRNVSRRLGAFEEGANVRAVTELASAPLPRMVEMGFSNPPAIGECVLPSAMLGPSARRNAEGWIEVHKDQPKEQCSRSALWRWTEFRGRYDREERERIVDIPYERYPRTEHLAPGIEFTILRRSDGVAFVSSPSFDSSSEEEREGLTLAVNVLLDAFGGCELVRADLFPPLSGRVRRLNWEVLPRGRAPWSLFRPRVEQVVNEAPEGNRPVVLHRLETVDTYGPDFVAVGRAGFRGYLVFGFGDRGLYVLESMSVNNATYVLVGDWESISQRTKAEILSENLHRDRLIHREGWAQQLNAVMAGAGRP